MSGINKVTILGRLGQDPEVRYMQNGDAVCNLSIATSIEWKDKQTGEQKQKTEWHRVVLYKGQAQVAEKYLKKGGQAAVEGRLQTKKWQDKGGVDHYTTEIVAESLHLIGGKTGEKEPEPMPSSELPPSHKSFDDDIPF